MLEGGTICAIIRGCVSGAITCAMVVVFAVLAAATA
jgi:hypothetical protein